MRIKRDFIFDSSLVLYLPFYDLDGASFMSQDAYGHLCTVTGALWRLYGRWFDGIDDYLKVTKSTPLEMGANQDFTLMAWLNHNSETDGGILCKGANNDTTDTGYRFTYQDSIGIRINNGSSAIGKTGSSISANVWHHAAATFDRDGLAAIFIDGGIDTTVDISSFASSDLTNSTDLWIGSRSAGAGLWNGLIGEVLIYKRSLTPLEIQHNYLATKWRYR